MAGQRCFSLHFWGVNALVRLHVEIALAQHFTPQKAFLMT